MLLEALGAIAVRVFGNWSDSMEESLSPLKRALLEADLKILFRGYVSIMMFLMLLAFLASIPLALFLAVFWKLNTIIEIIFLVFLPIILGLITFALAYYYPFYMANSRKRDIEINLPFAVNHIAAIAGSGVPTYIIFKLLVGFGEYGEISKEAKKIVRNIEIFGQGAATAIRQVAERTPSKPFKDFLDGLVTTIETGGNLQLYLKSQGDKALFEYRLRRERYMELLATYADFYTAVMITAPLFLIAILAIMNMIGGELFGYKIQDIMSIGIFAIIPIVNVGFLAFIHFTQPEL